MNDMLNMILTKDEIGRITERLAGDGMREITMDLHQLTVKQAKRLITNVMAVSRDGCEMRLIHGFNHGTAIKEMVNRDLQSPRIRDRRQAKNNPGLTTLTIAAA